MWGVEVRRIERCTVYVHCADPVEARRIALEHAADFVGETHATAYEVPGKFNDRYWRGDAWVYPATTMFGAS